MEGSSAIFTKLSDSSNVLMIIKKNYKNYPSRPYDLLDKKVRFRYIVEERILAFCSEVK